MKVPVVGLDKGQGRRFGLRHNEVRLVKGLFYFIRKFLFSIFCRSGKVGHRISKVVTRTGDRGETGLANGSRVPKDSLRIVAIGDVDELNSIIGLVVSENEVTDMNAELQIVQNELFNLGGELALGKHALIDEERVIRLEEWICFRNEKLLPLREFILPGGSRTAALLHLARSVCRRAERSVVALGRTEDISPVLQRYLNRLSDLLFVYARLANQLEKRSDVFWKK